MASRINGLGRRWDEQGGGRPGGVGLNMVVRDSEFEDPWFRVLIGMGKWGFGLANLKIWLKGRGARLGFCE